MTARSHLAWASGMLALVAQAAGPAVVTTDASAGEVRFGIQERAGGAVPEAWLVIQFATSREETLAGGRNGAPAARVVELGHRAVSFDLPAHGARIDARGAGITGLRNLILAGVDPFQSVIIDGRAVIDECLRRGWAAPGRIAVCGVSRGGYFAARLAAADERVAAVALLAPVTDWRELREFAPDRERAELPPLVLGNFAARLAGRRLYVAIGDADERVNTEACVRFVAALTAAARAKKIERPHIRFHLADDSPGHALANRWRMEGVDFLIGAER
ncbi:MAG: prolyl oligopeptidase family serine peptidase [Opitutaceae bacterium]|nr:prolyl oligopeptidase family serine peptidase [Opitutaceae bacterium]